MKKSRRELPPSLKVNTPAELFSATVMIAGKASLTIYGNKPNKSIFILSTKHPTVFIGAERKKKPDTVTDYSHTKVCWQTLINHLSSIQLIANFF